MEQNPQLARWRRLLTWLLVASFAFACCTILWRSTTSRMTLGNWYTDHISHAHAAVLFYYRGYDIYQAPVKELLKPDTTAAAYALQEDLPADELFCLPERRRPEIPLHLNWPALARVYPPGLYLYTLPEALALECSDLPLWAINAFSLLKYSLVAHLLLWFFLDFLLVHYSWGGKLWGVLPGRTVLLLVMLAVQVQVCFWAVAGFYDGLALLFLVLLVMSYHRQLWSRTLFFFALAVFFHYRSLWFLPLAGAAVVQLGWEGGKKALFSRREGPLLWSSLLLLTVSGSFFLLAYPSMVQFPLKNPLYLRALSLNDIPWVPLAVFLAFLGVLVRRQDWLLLASVAGVLLFLLNTRQLQHWHSLSLIPLVLCSRYHSLTGLCSGAVAYGLLSPLFFHVCPFNPVWCRLYSLGA